MATTSSRADACLLLSAGSEGRVAVATAATTTVTRRIKRMTRRRMTAKMIDGEAEGRGGARRGAEISCRAAPNNERSVRPYAAWRRAGRRRRPLAKRGRRAGRRR